MTTDLFTAAAARAEFDDNLAVIRGYRRQLVNGSAPGSLNVTHRLMQITVETAIRWAYEYVRLGGAKVTSTQLSWNVDPDAVNGTGFLGYFEHASWSFAETVARLKALSGQDPTANTDQYKVSVEFIGRINGQVFTLYDYKGDMSLHIGGTDRAILPVLIDALVEALAAVAPVPYTARVNYDGDGTSHGWPEPLAPVVPSLREAAEKAIAFVPVWLQDELRAALKGGVQ